MDKSLFHLLSNGYSVGVWALCLGLTGLLIQSNLDRGQHAFSIPPEVIFSMVVDGKESSTLELRSGERRLGSLVVQSNEGSVANEARLRVNGSGSEILDGERPTTWQFALSLDVNPSERLLRKVKMSFDYGDPLLRGEGEFDHETDWIQAKLWFGTLSLLNFKGHREDFQNEFLSYFPGFESLTNAKNMSALSLLEKVKYRAVRSQAWFDGTSMEVIAIHLALDYEGSHQGIILLSPLGQVLFFSLGEMLVGTLDGVTTVSLTPLSSSR